MRFLYIFLLTNLIFAWNVTVDVDSRRINEGDSVTLTVRSVNSKNAPQVVLPNFIDFMVVSGPNQSSSSNYSILNGKLESSSTYILEWVLIPRKFGRLKIPSLSIKLDGQVSKTNPIFISVSKRSQNSNKDAQYFVEASIDNTSPYRGEQVTLTYTLFTRVDVTGFDEKMPRFKGFWVEELYSPSKLQLRQVQKNGRQYHSATIKKNALFPTKSGKIIIEPLIATIGVRDRKKNSFSVFGSPSKQFTISTQSITLDVKPLPDTNDGQTSAVVGLWNIKSTIDRLSVLQDEALKIKVHLTGNGNLKSVDILPYEFPEGFEVFEPKVTIKSSKSQIKIGGEKIIEYVVIPRIAGKIIIPPFEIKYFDNVNKKWKTKSSKPINLLVKINEKSSTATVGLSKEEIQLVGKDIRFMDDGKPRWQKTNSGLMDKITLILATLALLLFLFPGMINMRQSHLDSTMDERRSQKAYKNAISIIRPISDPPIIVHGSIHKAIIVYINYKTGRKSAEYSITEIINIFEINDVPTNLIDNLKKIMEHGEAVRFAPVSVADIQNDIEGVKTILKEADNAWS